MSTPVTKAITCPHCACRGYATAWESIDAAQDPELREKLLDGSLLVFECAQCHGKSPVTYNLLYHDPNRRCMIWLSVDEEKPPAPTTSHGKPYVLRLVKTTEELLEKIRLVEAGIDDRVMELFKLALFGSILSQDAKTDGWLVYQGQTLTPTLAMTFVLVGPTGPHTIHVPRTEYAAFAAQYGPKLHWVPGPWPTIDAAWAIRALEPQPNQN